MTGIIAFVSKRRQAQWSAFGATIMCGLVLAAWAATPAGAIDWDDAGNSASKLWDDNGNWNPNGDPDSEPVFIGNLANAANDTTLVDRFYSIDSLTITNGADVINSTSNGATDDFEILVNGATTVSDAGSSIIIYGGDLDGLDTDTLTITSGATVSLNSATAAGTAVLEVDGGAGPADLDVNADGTLNGNGRIDLESVLASPTTVLFNNGTITATQLGLIFGPPAAGTLQITADDADARFDWDGGGGGMLQANGNQTLDIDVDPGLDAFSGTMNLGTGSTIDIANTWELDSGTINANTPSFFIIIGEDPLPGPAAHVAGASWTMTGGTVNVDDAWDSIQFDSQLTTTGGTIANSGTVIFNNTATIGAGTDFQMNGVDAGMTVNPGVTVTINDADMDFDGSGSSTNFITVEEDGRLNLNLDSFEGNDRADGVIVLNSSTLSLTVTDGSWTMDRRLHLNHTAISNPVLSGSAVQIGADSGTNDAQVTVTGPGSSQINVPVTWNSDTDLEVTAGATLAVLGFSTFNSVNGPESAQYLGPGNVFFSGGLVNEATTFDFSGGTVGLDGGGAVVILLSAPDFTIDAPLTINAAQLDEYGRSVVFPAPDTAVLTINANLGGQLSVNLDDSSASWTINGVGIFNVNGGNVLFETFLDGNDLNMNGAMSVDGFSRTDARLTIGATGVVSFNDAAANLRLVGGDLADTNRLEGGAINGPGEVSAINARALHGHGTIGANIDFDGATSELLADDGTLTLSGAILDVGVIGTADGDGVLDVVNAWNTNVTTTVLLAGGVLQGANITNDGANGIDGFGEVTARIINNTHISADGGTMIYDNPDNDWDGAANAGQIIADNGNIEMRDSAVFFFNGGTLIANDGFEVFANGFELQFQGGSTLQLDGGTYRSTDMTDFFGTINTTIAPATIGPMPQARIRSTAVVTLNSDLRLDADSLIDAGATFAGGGSLINLPTRTMTLQDGADVGVLLDNRGTLILGASPGQTTGLDFQQAATGTLEIELQGAGLNDFDRMTLTGAASLAGTLDVSLIGGFLPNVGEMFSILSATGGVFGTFDTEGVPIFDAKTFDVIYNANSVVLEVINAILFGDANNDGQVTGADLIAVQQNFGNVGPPNDGTLLGDANDDGQVTGADLIAVQQNFGNVLGPGGASVPEPASLVVGALWLTLVRRARQLR